MNTAWFKFIGMELGMSGMEVMITRYGEMLDLLACRSISNGTLLPAKIKRKMSFDEAMALK